MSVVFLSLFLIFELIQDAALMDSMLYSNIFKILNIYMFNIPKEKLHISCLLSFWNSTVQTATISFGLNFIFKSFGTALFETVGSY